MSALPRPEDERYAPMSEGDLDEVVAAEKEIYPFPWTRGNFADALHAGYSAWVLRDGQRGLAAYAVMMIALDEAHLLNLSVARGARHVGPGLGERALGAAGVAIGDLALGLAQDLVGVHGVSKGQAGTASKGAVRRSPSLNGMVPCHM